MGGNFSEPLPDLLSAAGSDFSSPAESGRGESGGGKSNFGFVCMVLRSYDKLRVLHAPRDVLEAVDRIVRDLSHGETAASEDRYGCAQFRLPGSPFVLSAGRESATVGKLAAIRVFEEMNALGYDLVTSSDLYRAYDQSSWFFR